MKTAGLIAALLLMTAFVANAQEPEGWRFEVTPTAWTAGIEGTITVDGQETEFDKSASDLIDYVEFAGGVIGSAYYDRWCLRVQFDHISLSTDALEVEDQPQGGKLDSDIFFTEAAVGYWLGSLKKGGSNYVFVGLRSLHTDSDLEVFGADGGFYTRERNLLDPLVGVQGSFPIFPSKIKGLSIVAMMTIGGGGDSELIYGLQPTVQYQFTDDIGVRVGYRRLAWQVEKDKNGNKMDFSLAGLIAGLGVSF